VYCTGRLPTIKAVKGERVYNKTTPTTAQAEAVVDALKPSHWSSIAGELLWATGARKMEIGTLTRENIYLSSSPRIIVDGKTGRRAIPIGPEVATKLGAWLTTGVPSPDQCLWRIRLVSYRGTLNRTIESRCQRLGIPVFTAHGFRRLAASVLMHLKTDRKTYEAVMGHSFEIGSRIYAEVSAEHVSATSLQLGRAGSKVIEGPWLKRSAS